MTLSLSALWNHHFTHQMRQLLIIVLACLVLSACGETGVLGNDPPPKQVGQSYDIGGRTLNMFCSGQGSPTVIFESGRAAPGYVWTPTERGVAKFTRACWYDRAELGWSDSGPDPSWGDSAARDLHKLLLAAAIEPPFVLVGHSFGGYIIRLFNHFYPDEVSGMVFVDSALEDAGEIPGMPHRDPPPLPRQVIRNLSVTLGRLGWMRVIAGDSGPAPKGWRPEEWDVLSRLRRQPNVLLADAQEGPESATAKLMRGIDGLGNMPMIVLTQARPIRNQHSTEARVRTAWIALQRRFAHTSTRGRQVLVKTSGHDIPEEAPDAVITAVRKIVNTARKHTP